MTHAAATNVRARRSPTGPGVILVLLLGVPTITAAQEPPLPTAATEAELIAAVEELGAGHARAEPPPATPGTFAAWEGVAERRCVQVRPSVGNRSGEFVVRTGILPVSVGRVFKVSWSPLHNARRMELLVRGRNVSTMADSARFRRTDVAVPGVDAVDEDGKINSWFFPTGLVLHTPGRWLLVATSGPNWGCFVVTVEPG